MSYCRLCAEPKSDDDLCASINDLKLNILEKLIVCCQWNTYPFNPELPEHICFLCSEKLEKSWLFSVCVSESQRKLLQLLSDDELTFGTEEAGDDKGSLLDDNLGDIFVETIPIPELKSDPIEESIAEPDPIDELIGSTIELTNDKIVCVICEKTFTTVYNLTVHKRTHTNERPYVCWSENCDKQFKSSSNLNQHLRKVHGKPPYAPRPREIIATEVIKNLVEMPKIAKVENPPEKEHFNETCDICGRKFRLKCTLKAHRTIHFSERKFECTLCHRAFKRMKLLRVHMQTHTKFPSIPCPIPSCRKLFRRNCQRDTHIKERHGQKPKRVNKPPAPPKKPLKKYTCELCGLSFTQKGGLSTHMTVHSDNRPFKCDFCNLGFKRKRTMQDHRKTHTHSHEFKCDQDGCQKAFRKKISLLRHREYHSGQIYRPFVCERCGKGFRLNANLVEHQRIHTGERPYSCEYKPCSQTFRTMSSFYSHLKKEHGVSVMARKLEQQARATALTQAP